MVCTNAFKDLEATDFGEIEVEDHGVVAGILLRGLLQFGQCGFAVLRHVHVYRPATATQHLGEQDDVPWIVFHQQDHALIVELASVKCISVPPSAADSTQIRPPCDFTTRAQMDKPMPEPGNSPRCSNRTKGEKMRSC